MPLSGQELHFADQIDGLLDRVNKLERYLGGRWKVADGSEPTTCLGIIKSGKCSCGMHISEVDRYREALEHMANNYGVINDYPRWAQRVLAGKRFQHD